MASISKEKSDLYSWDLLWSLFTVALKSYRVDSVLRPFPPMYVDLSAKDKDVSRLRKVSDNLPAVKEILNNDELHSETISLFQWVTEPPSFKLELQNLDQFDEILKLTKQEGKTCHPHYIFKVIYCEDREERFQKSVNGRSTLYAYHGSSLENFHSILHNGLAWHLSKEGLFGCGTYLSSEMSVSLHYSYGSSGWPKSLLGPKLSCVAVCEFVNDGSSTCCQKDRKDLLFTSRHESNCKLPEKYYIIRNNDHVQVRYLLVFSYGDITNKKLASSWWRKYWMLIFCISYVIFLIIIGLSKCSSLQSIVNYIHR